MTLLTRLPGASLCASICACLCFGLGPNHAPLDGGEFVAYGLDLEPLAVACLPAPATENLSRIARATGFNVAELRLSSLFAGRVLFGEEEVEVRMGRVPFVQGKDTLFALYALREDGSFLAASVVDEGGTPVEEWRPMLNNFAFYRVPKLKGAKPRRHLQDLEQNAREHPKAPGSRDVLQLLRVLALMQEQASVFNLPQGGPDRDAAQEARMMQANYRALADMSPSLGSLLGSLEPDFERTAMASSTAAGQLLHAIQDEDPSAIQRARGQITSNCGRCHRKRHPEDGQFLTERFAALREKLGIGGGYYQVGHDLRISHWDKDRTQQVADNMRVAALLLDAPSPN